MHAIDKCLHPCGLYSTTSTLVNVHLPFTPQGGSIYMVTGTPFGVYVIHPVFNSAVGYLT